MSLVSVIYDLYYEGRSALIFFCISFMACGICFVTLHTLTLEDMNQKLTTLPSSEIRKLLLEESKKFNAAIQFGSPVGHMEEIQQQIHMLELILRDKDSGRSPEQR